MSRPFSPESTVPLWARSPPDPVNLLDRIGNAWSALTSKSAPGGSYGAGYGGGSWFSDSFRTRRAPSPSELVDAYKSLVFACVNLNANAVARTPLRLFATT